MDMLVGEFAFHSCPPKNHTIIGPFNVTPMTWSSFLSSLGSLQAGLGSKIYLWIVFL